MTCPKDGHRTLLWLLKDALSPVQKGVLHKRGAKGAEEMKLFPPFFFSPSHLHSLALAFISVDKLIIYHMLLSFPVQTARSSLFVMAAKSVAHGSWHCSHDGL